MVRQKMVEQFGEDACHHGTARLHCHRQAPARRSPGAARRRLRLRDTRYGYRGLTALLGNRRSGLGYDQIMARLAKQLSLSAPDGPPWSCLGDKAPPWVLRNGKQAELGWNGVKWARAFITDDRQFLPRKSARGMQLRVGA